MKTACLIGVAAFAAAAAADETYSTFGADWSWSLPWETMGQTMVVPEGAPVLDSFEFLGETSGEDPILYVIAVYLWDEQAGHVAGDSLFAEFGVLEPGDDPLHQHDIGVLLPEGETIAVAMTFGDAPWGLDHAVAVAADVFDGGGAIATGGSLHNPWQLPDPPNDLIFTAEWTVCAADVYADGILNIFDFLAFQGLYNNADMKADFNADGLLNVLDFVAFQAAFQQGCGG